MNLSDEDRLHEELEQNLREAYFKFRSTQIDHYQSFIQNCHAHHVNESFLLQTLVHSIGKHHLWDNSLVHVLLEVAKHKYFACVGSLVMDYGLRFHPFALLHLVCDVEGFTFEDAMKLLIAVQGEGGLNPNARYSRKMDILQTYCYRITYDPSVNIDVNLVKGMVRWGVDPSSVVGTTHVTALAMLQTLLQTPSQSLRRPLSQEDIPKIQEIIEYLTAETRVLRPR